MCRLFRDGSWRRGSARSAGGAAGLLVEYPIPSEVREVKDLDQQLGTWGERVGGEEDGRAP